MNPVAPRPRAGLVAFVVVCLFLVVLFFKTVPTTEAVKGDPALVPIIGVTKTAALVAGNGDADADPGDTIEYTITVNNTGPDPGTNVVVTDTLQNIQTLVAGSLAVSPIAVNDTFASIGNVGITVPDGASDLMANDTNPGGGGTLSITPIVNGPTTQLGTVNVSADGSFTYNPAPGFEGADTFTYTLTNGSGLTNQGTVTINVAGMIWFVQTGAAAGGDGRLGTPFNCFVGVSCFDDTTLDQPADNIFLYTGAYIGGQTLLANQRLIGQGATAALAGPGSITGITIPPFSNTLPATGGVRPTMTTALAGTSAITLGSGNTLRGFNIGDTTAADIIGTGIGTLTALEMDLNGTGRPLVLTTGNVAAAFGTLTSTSSTGGAAVSLSAIGGTLTAGSAVLTGGVEGINLFAMSGTVTITTVNINGQSGDGINITSSTGTTNISGGTVGNTDDPGGNAVEVNGSNGNVTIAAALTKTTAGKIVLVTARTGNTVALSGNISATGAVDNGIDVNNNPAGIVNFSGATKTINTGASSAVSLATNGTAVINFTNGGLVLNSTTGTTFTATGGGTFTVQGTGNTINATNGPANTSSSAALNVVSTTIGASGLTFQSISSGNANASPDPANGIVLNTAGTGGLTVTGTGTTDGSGGTIRSTTSSGVRIVSSDNLNLSNINLIGNGTAQTVAGSDTNCGGAITSGNNLSCVANLFLQTVTGVTLTNVDVTNGGQQGINGNDVTTLTVANSNITGNGNEPFENGVLFRNLKGTCTVTNTMIKDNASYQWAMANVQNGSTLTLSFTGTRTNNVYPAVDSSTTELGKTTQTNTNTNQTFLFDSIVGSTGVNATINFTGVVFKNSLPGNSMLLNAPAGSGSLNGTTTNTSFDNTAGGVIIQAQNGMGVNYDITNSEFNKVNLQSILFGAANPYNATLHGVATGNHIGEDQTGTNGQACEPLATSNCHGIDVNMIGGSGTINALISNNTIQQFGGTAVNATANGTTAPSVNVTVTGNTIKNPAGLIAHGIQTNMGTTANANVQGCLSIGGAGGLANTITGTYEDPGAGVQFGIVTNVRFLSHHRMPGYAGSPTDVGAPPAATAVFLNNQNAVGGKVFTQRGGSGDYPGGAACTQPSFAKQDDEQEQDQVSLLGPSYQPPPILGQWNRLNPEFSVQSSIRDAQITASAEAYVSTDRLDTPDYLEKISEILNIAGNLASGSVAKIGAVVSPTAHAQKEELPKGETANAPESGETVTVPAFTLPAGESITVRFRSTVDNGPYASGVNNITNTVTVTADGGISVPASSTPIALDAAPDLQVTVSDGGITTQPGVVVQYTTTYQNNTAINGQHAAAVRITQTVPINTTFNLAVSGGGWSCPDGSIGGTVCTFDVVGGVNAGAPPAAVNFAVNVLAALPAGAVQISDTASIAENPVNANGTDRVPANNTSNDTTNIIGNWDGSTSTAWAVNTNWSNDVTPPAGNNVSIPDVANAPLITTAVSLNNLVLNGENLTIDAPGVVTLSGNLTLGANIISGTGQINLGTASAINRTTGQINCTLQKNFAGPTPVGTPFVFPIGTTGAFSPLTVTVTNGAGQLTARANVPFQPALASISTRVLQRYWTLSGSGIRSNITFQYLDSDVPGAPNNENIWNVIRVTGTTIIRYPPGPNVALNPAANTFTVSNLETYSDWTAGEPLAPTAAYATVSGRVTDAEGRGVPGAVISMQDQGGNVIHAITNPFGYYRFASVATGQNYLIAPRHKRFTFEPRSISVNDDVAGVDFIPSP